MQLDLQLWNAGAEKNSGLTLRFYLDASNAVADSKYVSTSNQL